MAKPSKVAKTLEIWAAQYCAARDLFRVFKRAATSPSEHLRDTFAVLQMRTILARARSGDETAQDLWKRASGIGQGRRVSPVTRAIDDEFLKIIDAGDTAAAINELIRDWKLEGSIATMNEEIAIGYGVSSAAKVPPTLPLPLGSRLSKADLNRILDAMLSVADPERERKEEAEALTPGRRVEQRLEPLRKVHGKIRDRRKKKTGARKGSGRAPRA